MSEDKAIEVLERLLEEHQYWTREFEAIELAILALSRLATDGPSR